MKIHERYRWPRWAVGVGAAAVLVVGTWVGFDRYHGAPLAVAAQLERITIDASQTKADLAWPAYGQAAVATKAYGVLATHGATAPQPTASTAKLILAVAIMQKKPYSDGKGETITLTQVDVNRYQTYVAGNGTVAAVANGLTWTQHQALQAVMLASANNVSDTLAIWAFGSLEGYRAYAQQMVRDFGMNDTTIGIDASGYSATTTSTAHDLALIATKALTYQPLRDIVAMQTVTLPVAGTITNTNRLLADGDIIGMKTGWIPEAGGIFVLAGRQTSGEHSHEIITVVMGAPGGASRVAQDAAYQLYQSAKANFSYRQVLASGAEVGTYQPPWVSEPLTVTTRKPVSMFVWSDASPTVALQARTITSGDEGQVGEARVSYGAWSTTVPLDIQTPVKAPSVWWRVVERG